jgi:hypothetical protein
LRSGWERRQRRLVEERRVVVVVQDSSASLAMNDSRTERRIHSLIRAGQELVPALTGAAVGSQGGLPGALLGAGLALGVGQAMQAVGDEIEQRVLGPRQRERVGAAWTIAARQIEERRSAGEQLRDDGFFERGEGPRSDGEEVLEGVLLAAADSFEERKIPFMANLFASLAFRSDINAPFAHYLARMAERLTYRQLCLLSAFCDERWQGPLFDIQRLHDEVRGFEPPETTPSIAAELNALGADGLLGRSEGPRGTATYQAVLWDGNVAASLEGIVPTHLGVAIFEVLGLSGIPDGDLAGTLGELAGDPDWRRHF